MKIAAFALAAAVTSVSSATFVDYVVTKTQTSNSGVDLDVYTLWARFDGATDTIVNAFNFNRLDGSATNMFYHKDNASYNDGVLMKAFGTWNPAQTGSNSANRPFDSYVTIGGQALGTNSTNADPSWGVLSWTRPDVPNGANVGWFNSNPPNLQGRVGVGANTATDVRLGQFVVDRNANGGTWNLKIGYTDGVTTTVQFAETSFSLPAPGAVALLGLAGLAGRRRR
jgi:hypothetical protein